MENVIASVALSIVAGLIAGMVGTFIAFGTMPSLKDCEIQSGKRCHWVATPMDDRP